MGQTRKRMERVYEPSRDSDSNHLSDDRSSEPDAGEIDSEDSAYKPSKPSKKPSKKKSSPQKPKVERVPKPKALPSKVSISTLAVNPEESDSAKDSLSHVDQSVISRILKALNLANHAGTGEQEAKAALRMAYKLMSQHSVTQAAVLATVEDSNEKLQKAGQSAVTIRSQPGKSLREGSWCSTVACSMNEFFNCKHYTEEYRDDDDNKNRLDLCFYGLAEQTAAAAFAFEMVYNLIMTWRAEKKDAKGIHGKNSYCHGVADGLLTLAQDEKAREEREARTKEQKRLENAKKEEEAERQRQVERLAHPDVEPEGAVKVEAEDNAPIDRRPKVEEVDDVDMLRVSDNAAHSHVKAEPDIIQPSTFQHAPSPQEDDDDDAGDFFVGPGYFDNINGHDDVLKADFNDADDDPLNLDAAEPEVKVEKEHSGTIPETASNVADVHPPVKDEPQDESPWDSAKQLVAFRETTAALADDFLKQKGIKLLKGRKQMPLYFKDKDAKRIYKQGREDAKKIDVKRRRIMEAEEDLVY